MELASLVRRVVNTCADQSGMFAGKTTQGPYGWCGLTNICIGNVLVPNCMSQNLTIFDGYPQPWDEGGAALLVQKRKK